MKTFNKVISVEIEVDQVASMLLDAMKTDFAHREVLTETIIGAALNHGTVGNIYNNLIGYNNDLNFSVGQIVKVKDLKYYTNDGHKEVGEVQITEIDINKPAEKVRINYVKAGSSTPTFEWVNHSRLTLVEFPTEWKSAAKEVIAD